MNETKLLKLLGISLIVGILGFLGSCKKEDDNNEALLLGAAVVQQQAAEASAAEYNAQNNATKPDFYCEITFTYGSNTTKQLIPLPAAECNIGYFSESEYKNRLIARIDSEFASSCSNTRTAIINASSTDYPGPTSANFKSGQSIAQYLASAYGFNASDLTVISPAKYKSYTEYIAIKSRAQTISEGDCVNAVDNKLDLEHPNKDKYCQLHIDCSPPNKNIVYSGSCKVSVSGSSSLQDCPL